MDKQTEYKIIDRVLDGEVQSFSILVQQYKDMVYTLSLKMLRNPEEAEEMAQDVFVRAFRKLSQFDKKSKFSTWLYSITYRTGLNILKKTRVREEEFVDEHLEIPSEGLNPFTALAKTEAKKILRERIKKLDAESQFLLQIYYFEERSIREVAQVMGQSETNVKSKLFRTRKKLREILSPQL